MHVNKHLYYRKFYLEKSLNKFVKYAWIMKSYETKSKPDLLIPDGYPEIIFVKKGAYCKELLDQNSTSTIIKRSCIIGIQTTSVLASRMNNCHLIGLKLNPIGAHTLFGHRLKTIFNTNKLLSEFGVGWLEELNQDLTDYEEEASIIKLLSKSFLQQTNCLEQQPTNEEAHSFLAFILSHHGQITVQELANHHHLSIRHFQRKFKSFFGITPKKFLNIIRFKHLYKSSILQRKPSVNFLDYGYYDQMHFIKDFQKNLGTNPSKSAEPTFLRLNQMAQMNA